MSQAFSFEGMAFSANFPTQTMAFIVPKGTPVTGGVFRIERVRTVTEADEKAMPSPPDHQCPLCGSTEKW